MNENPSAGGCHFCTETDSIEEHHIVPQRYNGSEEPKNLVSVCATCHSKLESLYNDEFYKELGVGTPAGFSERNCGKDGCFAEAEKRVTSRRAGPRFYCTEHFDCDKERCTETPKTTVPYRHGDYLSSLCDDHRKCSKADCGAKKTELVIWQRSRENTFRDPPKNIRAYCNHHATVIEADDSKQVLEAEEVL